MHTGDTLLGQINDYRSGVIAAGNDQSADAELRQALFDSFVFVLVFDLGNLDPLVPRLGTSLSNRKSVYTGRGQFYQRFHIYQIVQAGVSIRNGDSRKAFSSSHLGGALDDCIEAAAIAATSYNPDSCHFHVGIFLSWSISRQVYAS